MGGGGAARPPQHVKVFEQILGRHITQAGYGLTETTALGATNVGETYLAHSDRVGRPTPPLVEAKIVDENGRPLKNGEIGDVGIIEYEGFIYIKNRAKDLVFRGGREHRLP